MLAKLIAKVEPRESSAPTFEEARAAFLAAKAEWHAVNAADEALRVLNTWRSTSEVDRESDRFAWCRAKMDEHWPAGRPQPFAWRIPNLVAAAQEAIELAHSKWFAAQQAWEHARTKETSRVAKSLQPRQRAAVRKIADAAEKLSEAMAEERALHDELARTSPIGISSYLPPCSPRIAGLEDYRGELSAWRKRIRNLGILD
jgi:hypothetical protein